MAFTWKKIYQKLNLYFANDYRRWTRICKCAAFDDIIRGRKEIE
jgi:hypothetical protein